MKSKAGLGLPGLPVRRSGSSKPGLPGKRPSTILMRAESMKAATSTDSQARKAENVRAMFGAIAHRYDLANHVLSLNFDRRWRRFAVRQIVARLNRQDFDALDLACGTGDLTAALGAATSGRVVGLDFCHPMLVIGADKLARQNRRSLVALSEADALKLPLRNASFDAVTIAFGLRNLEDYETGLSEMRRVLRLGGVLAVLEFSRPSIPVFRHVYQMYFSKVLPWIGARLSGVEGPYDYLPDSVSKFPTREELKERMEEIGFADVVFFNLSGGIAALHLGTKQ